MATKLAPAHREIDGQPIKTTDIARVPARKRPRASARMGDRVPAPARVGDRTPKRTRAHEEKD